MHQASLSEDKSVFTGHCQDFQGDKINDIVKKRAERWMDKLRIGEEEGAARTPEGTRAQTAPLKDTKEEYLVCGGASSSSDVAQGNTGSSSTKRIREDDGQESEESFANVGWYEVSG